VEAPGKAARQVEIEASACGHGKGGRGAHAVLAGGERSGGVRGSEQELGKGSDARGLAQRITRAGKIVGEREVEAAGGDVAVGFGSGLGNEAEGVGEREGKRGAASVHREAAASVGRRVGVQLGVGQGQLRGGVRCQVASRSGWGLRGGRSKRDRSDDQQHGKCGSHIDSHRVSFTAAP